MAITNFVLTVVGVGAVALLMKSDVRTTSATLRRNLKHIRSWLEEEGAAAGRAAKEETQQLSKPEAPRPPRKEGGTDV